MKINTAAGPVALVGPGPRTPLGSLQEAFRQALASSVCAVLPDESRHAVAAARRIIQSLPDETGPVAVEGTTELLNLLGERWPELVRPAGPPVTGRYRYGSCPVCGRRKVLDRVGNITSRHAPCAGAGQAPATEVTA